MKRREDYEREGPPLKCNNLPHKGGYLAATAAGIACAQEDDGAVSLVILCNCAETSPDQVGVELTKQRADDLIGTLIAARNKAWPY